MKLDFRRDQFYYLLGFMARKHKEQLREIFEYFDEHGCVMEYSSIFENCPFNDTLEQSIKSYEIFSKKANINFPARLIDIIGEYVFLVSDFLPPCCQDGRTFYVQDNQGNILLCCDRCEYLYSLDEKYVDKIKYEKMVKYDFLELFGMGTSVNWPYHEEIKKMLRGGSNDLWLFRFITRIMKKYVK